jgi:signal transduction histidine kinase
VKLSLFNSDETVFERHVLSDGGKELRQFLTNSKSGKSLQVHEVKAPWFIETEQTWTREEMTARHKPGRPPVEDPGPFDGEIDAFDLESMQDKQAELFSSLGEYRNFVKRLAGVSIYRDGFAIRAESDWLGLGESWTSGRSYYGLKPNNTVGFVAISAADNQALIEKSDREGFLDNAASRGFEEIVETFVTFANNTLTVLRREFNNFRSQKKAADAKLPIAFKEADAVDALKRLGSAAAARSVSIKRSEDLRREAFLQLKSELQSAARLPTLDKVSRQALTAVETRLTRAVSTWEKAAGDVVAVANEFENEGRVGDAVIDRFEQLKGQNEELIDFVAIGLVAQALAHDVRMLLDDLLARTRRIAPKAKIPQSEDLAVYIESVRGTVHALRKQLTFLDPMQRATRETKQRVTMSKFLEELVQFREEKYQRHGIDAKVTVRDDFTVVINRGRLLQVFDNLLRNSEYWLQHSKTQRPAIRIAVDTPGVTLWDNGPGVKQTLEDTLFEPFVTDKPRGYGSGLGLFIVSQLLKKDGCDIRLQSMRNDKGRRYRFSIDFSGVAAD